MLRRNQHCKVRLAAGTRKCRGYVFLFSVWSFHAENQHVFCHPSLALAENGADAKCKTFLAEENIAAVSGVDAPDCVLFRELCDVFVFCVDLCL